MVRALKQCYRRSKRKLKALTRLHHWRVLEVLKAEEADPVSNIMGGSGIDCQYDEKSPVSSLLSCRLVVSSFPASSLERSMSWWIIGLIFVDLSERAKIDREVTAGKKRYYDQSSLTVRSYNSVTAGNQELEVLVADRRWHCLIFKLLLYVVEWLQRAREKRLFWFESGVWWSSRSKTLCKGLAP